MSRQESALPSYGPRYAKRSGVHCLWSSVCALSRCAKARKMLESGSSARPTIGTFAPLKLRCSATAIQSGPHKLWQSQDWSFAKGKRLYSCGASARTDSRSAATRAKPISGEQSPLIRGIQSSEPTCLENLMGVSCQVCSGRIRTSSAEVANRGMTKGRRKDDARRGNTRDMCTASSAIADVASGLRPLPGPRPRRPARPAASSTPPTSGPDCAGQGHLGGVSLDLGGVSRRRVSAACHSTSAACRSTSAGSRPRWCATEVERQAPTRRRGRPQKTSRQMNRTPKAAVNHA
jgi:hypothetical protein